MNKEKPKITKNRWGGARKFEEKPIPIRRDSTGDKINPVRTYKEYLYLHNINNNKI